MKFKFEAEDLLDRINKHKSVFTKQQIVEMINDTICSAVDISINDDVFKNVVQGDCKQELDAILNKIEELVENSQKYIEAAYLCCGDLSRKTKKQKYVAVQQDLIYSNKNIQEIYNKIVGVKNNLKQEK